MTGGRTTTHAPLLFTGFFERVFGIVFFSSVFPILFVEIESWFVTPILDPGFRSKDVRVKYCKILQFF